MNVGDKIEFKLITSSMFVPEAMWAAAQIARVFSDFESALWAAEILRKLCISEFDGELQELVFEDRSKSYALAGFLDALALEEPTSMAAGAMFAKTIRSIVLLKHTEILVNRLGDGVCKAKHTTK